ncbi:MAG: triacylglycerol lipase [Actinomycetota bacterium]|nr:triacylglycerol lipase [Actinomycetota bacterium]
MRRVTRVTSVRWVGVSAALVAALVFASSVAAASAQYPVPYVFTANVVAGATQPGTPPPGSNNWTCRPSKAHPRPVVLVHGLFANMTDNWQTMSPLLANNGYCVFALTYGVDPAAAPPFDQFGGLTPMEQSAVELSRFVNRVLVATGAHKVDIVGHSEGATMPDYYIEYLGGAAKVARYVGISGVKHGTTLHGLGTFATAYGTLFPGAPDPTAGSCGSCQQFLVGSDYIAKIEARAPAGGVIYTNLATRYDELVSPHTSSFLKGPNVTNVTMQDHCALDFSDHLSIVSSPITGRYILNALDPAHALRPPCTLVLPAV